jgi:hypothetical protein
MTSRCLISNLETGEDIIARTCVSPGRLPDANLLASMFRQRSGNYSSRRRGGPGVVTKDIRLIHEQGTPPATPQGSSVKHLRPPVTSV